VIGESANGSNCLRGLALDVGRFVRMDQIALGGLVEHGCQLVAGFGGFFFVAGFNRNKSLLADGLHAAFLSAVPLGTGLGLTVALNCGFGVCHDVWN
jgi:hypothetical protein